MQTPYMVMSLQANEGCRRDKILAAIFSYITLNGFIVLPGTFTSLENLSSLSENKKGKVIQAAVQNIPLLPMAGICCFVGTMGSYWLWRKWRKNYIWLVAHILLPSLLQSIIGLTTILINVYTAHEGHWSVTATISITTITLYLGSTLALTLLYNNWLLENIKTPYDKELTKHNP